MNKEQTIYDKLITQLKRAELESFDNEMEEYEKLLKKIEETRKEFILYWGDLIYKTGSIVLIKPNFTSALFGFFFQISRDLSVFVFNLRSM